MRWILRAIMLAAGCALVGCNASAPSASDDRLLPSNNTGPRSADIFRPSKLHHPVSTSNDVAQRHFDDGLTYVYAFNHEEAFESFRKANAADPKLAMAYWGMALAQGPNYNDSDISADRAKAAYDAIQHAIALSKDAPEHERDYILALAKRFAPDPASADAKKLAADYKTAMGELAKKYPDDLDAATLNADAAMNLRPWKLYSGDGTPAEGTDELVAVLESVLRRDPDHVGANHLYIHAVEASRHPERALESAGRLPGLAPTCGHLVHMPSHIYSRTGEYVASAGSNEAAIQADETYFKHGGKTSGMYAMLYYPHNIHFLAVAATDAGNFKDARAAADKLAAYAMPKVKDVPMLEGFVPTPIYVLVRFRKWDEMLALPEPDKATAAAAHALWHFGRGMAQAGKGNVAQAAAEHLALAAERKALPANEMLSMFNKPDDLLALAEHTLAARLAQARSDPKAAAEHLRAAIAIEDTLAYMEPPDWYLPARETLGAVLLRGGDAAAAEKVFREDLDRHARSGRSLFGLVQSLKAQGKMYEAQLVRQQFDAAWAGADTTLRVEDL